MPSELSDRISADAQPIAGDAQLIARRNWTAVHPHSADHRSEAVHAAGNTPANKTFAPARVLSRRAQALQGFGKFSAGRATCRFLATGFTLR